MSTPPNNKAARNTRRDSLRVILDKEDVAAFDTYRSSHEKCSILAAQGASDKNRVGRAHRRNSVDDTKKPSRLASEGLTVWWVVQGLNL